MKKIIIIPGKLKSGTMSLHPEYNLVFACRPIPKRMSFACPSMRNGSLTKTVNVSWMRYMLFS